jgi:hypothetical protein
LRRTVSANRIEGTMKWIIRSNGGRCSYVAQHTGPFVFLFNSDTINGDTTMGPIEVLSTKGACPTVWDKTGQHKTFTAPWSKIE